MTTTIVDTHEQFRHTRIVGNGDPICGNCGCFTWNYSFEQKQYSCGSCAECWDSLAVDASSHVESWREYGRIQAQKMGLRLVGCAQAQICIGGLEFVELI